VVEDLLELSRLFGVKELEEEIERRLATPNLVESLLARPVSNSLSADLARAFDNALFADLVIHLPPHQDDNAENEAAREKNESEEAEEAEERGEDQPTSIRAHKCVLAARSRYFNAMLLSGLKESQMGEIVVSSHVRPSVFATLARYLYTGLADIAPDVVVELFVAANAYSIEDLVRRCELMIESALEMDIVADLWAMARLYSSQELEQVCVNYVFKELDEREKRRLAEESSSDDDALGPAFGHLSADVLEAVCSRLQTQQAGAFRLACTLRSCGWVLTKLYT
jgi:hypothetical protein